ncbi:hypothetical protein [Campylobacter jejuni]|uniref:hypothetical protein n=1 Tax=Campylobacter jejuni TaxID=197 RepID=UPI003671CB8E
MGKYPTTTLSSAREKANIFNNMLTEKIDPKEQIQKEDVGGKIKCRKRKIKCRIFATNYLSFNLKLKL